MATDAVIPSDRLKAALAAIDQANADDPHTIEVDGQARPKEQAHAELMTEWVQRLDSDAHDAQLVAARAHHLRRWALPRSDYPEGRSGYLRWRTAQAKRHAAEVADIVTAVGYDDAFAADVSAIVAKRGLATDPRVQTHEDALCLVFLQTQFDELADKLGDDHMAEVLAKTLAKMSPAARRIAQDLELSERAAALLEAASG
ncbi:MAG: DUF4202 domain-containing protein [Acidimicrobiia bacterium]|nr:DUF4202 domain-containing protein [Acidimicrobiia bacterium]MYB73425.1 DUF4202 domain-containing protein [Acidimicrobiia bacterium]MYH98594.1 DUF4202 domain-containing protein [Acidimicrobiia bacterium]